MINCKQMFSYFP